MSNTKKLKRFTTVSVIALSAIISACGSDSGSGPASSSEQAETVYGLGECKDANIGKTKLVTSENMYYKCENGKWSKTAAPSGNGTVAENVLFDARDGQTYRTVTIGTQTWMAENLNYKDAVSWCYDNADAYCTTYGRLYAWDVAMVVCPTGWHLPTKAEWQTLIAAAGGRDVAGAALKSTAGWKDGGNGNDSFGFAVLPAGRRSGESGGFSRLESTAYFWSATEDEYSGEKAYRLYLSHYDGHAPDMDKNGDPKIDAYSVRCVKD